MSSSETTLVKNLHRRFVLVAMAAVTLVLTVIMASINIANFVTLRQQADARLDYIVQCGGNVSTIFGEKRKEDPEFKKMLDGFGLTMDSLFEMRFFTVTLDAEGEVASVGVGRISSVDEDEAVSYARSLEGKGRQAGFVDSFRYRVVSADEMGVEPDDGTSYVFLDCSRDFDKFSSYLVVSVTVGAVGLVLVLILVMVFSRIVLKPVKESYVRQRRFITDASHEIKTPLAVIDAADEVLEIEYGQSEWTESIHEQVERLFNLTERLVLLSRMDEGADRLVRRPLDLTKLVEKVSDPFYTVAQSRGKRLELSLEEGVSYNGDAEEIGRAVELLLDNATRYASDGGTITVRLSSSGRGTRISVTNPVDEVPAGDLSKLFERFYRPDASRSSSTGGSGIGLSIVRAVAEAHGGEATVAADGDTITFSIRL